MTFVRLEYTLGLLLINNTTQNIHFGMARDAEHSPMDAREREALGLKKNSPNIIVDGE